MKAYAVSASRRAKLTVGRCLRARTDGQEAMIDSIRWHAPASARAAGLRL
jgi:hypothetical protein